jgi:hypothetical protein
MRRKGRRANVEQIDRRMIDSDPRNAAVDVDLQSGVLSVRTRHDLLPPDLI